MKSGEPLPKIAGSLHLESKTAGEGAAVVDAAYCMDRMSTGTGVNTVGRGRLISQCGGSVTFCA